MSERDKCDGCIIAENEGPFSGTCDDCRKNINRRRDQEEAATECICKCEPCGCEEVVHELEAKVSALQSHIASSESELRLRACLAKLVRAEAAAQSVLADLDAALAWQDSRGKGGQSVTASGVPFAYHQLTPSGMATLRRWRSALEAK